MFNIEHNGWTERRDAVWQLAAASNIEKHEEHLYLLEFFKFLT